MTNQLFTKHTQTLVYAYPCLNYDPVDATAFPTCACIIYMPLECNLRPLLTSESLVPGQTDSGNICGALCSFVEASPKISTS